MFRDYIYYLFKWELKLIYKIVLFLILNFAALGIGGFLMGEGPMSNWYQSINQAPWTPPGWVFGFAWTTIMICFSFYMSYAWVSESNKNLLITIYTIQWILNVIWNPVFFRYHQTYAALVIIFLLVLVVGYFLWNYKSLLQFKSLLILPYFIWLLIATTLNAYVCFKN